MAFSSTAMVLMSDQAKGPLSQEQFLQIHALEHRRIYNFLLRKGIQQSFMPLIGAVTPDWFGRHALMHTALERSLKVLGYPHLTGAAERQPWDTQDSFYDWQQQHTARHRQIALLIDGAL